MADGTLRVLAWDENAGHVSKEIYPGNIGAAVAEGLFPDAGTFGSL